MLVAQLRVAGCAFCAKLRVARLRVAPSKKLQRLRSVRIAKVALFERVVAPIRNATRNPQLFSIFLRRPCVRMRTLYIKN